MSRIAVINGPNLNMLGSREPGIYGSGSLDDIQRALKDRFQGRTELSFHQSNSEGELVSLVQGLVGAADGILLNAGAYTHTSVAIRDALLAVDIPFVEVHLSNVHAREEFRRHSCFSAIAVALVAGFRWRGYIAALDMLVATIEEEAG